MIQARTIGTPQTHVERTISYGRAKGSGGAGLTSEPPEREARYWAWEEPK